MKVKELCLCALFSAFIAIGAWIKIPVSFIPITLQTLFVILAALVLKKKAIYSVLLYLMIGLMGIPVFIGGGGLSYVMMPSFGYLLGFLICAGFVGRYQKTAYSSLFIRCVYGMLMIYAMGILYFVALQFFYYGKIYTLSFLLTSLCLVYIPGDLISIIAALFIYRRMEKIRNENF